MHPCLLSSQTLLLVQFKGITQHFQKSAYSLSSQDLYEKIGVILTSVGYSQQPVSSVIKTGNREKPLTWLTFTKPADKHL